MANVATGSRRRLSAKKVARVERHLDSSGLSPRQFTDDEIDRHYPETEYAAGWRISLDDRHQVDILLSADYPYQRAQIGVAPLRSDRPRERVFVDDTLCLMKGTEGHALGDDERVLDELIRRTREALEVAEDRQPRNSEEIVDYWKGNRAPRRVISIITVDAKPREVFYSSDLPFTVVGDSRFAVEAWVFNHSGKEVIAKKAAFITADTRFPIGKGDGRDLYGYFEENYPQQVPLLESLANGDPVSAPLLIGIVDAAGGVALLGCWLRRPRNFKVGKPRPATTPGFRPGKASGHLAAPYFFSAESTLERVRVERADPKWLTDRGGDGSADAVRAARVTLVGCGSLGGSIARLLAKAGVSEIDLIDPDILTYSNISRHELGARSVGRSKAKALAESISRDFPHVRTVPHGDTWQEVYGREPAVFDKATVIVSTTGDPASDVQLSDTAVAASAFSPLIFAWLEPYAAAAQALVIARDGCFRCGCDEFGVFRSRVTDWEGATTMFEPGCSTNWQPYSEVAALPAKAFVARVVLDTIEASPSESALHTWVGDDSLRNQHHGSLRPDWIATHSAPTASGGTHVNAWIKCPACSKRAA